MLCVSKEVIRKSICRKSDVECPVISYAKPLSDSEEITLSPIHSNHRQKIIPVAGSNRKMKVFGLKLFGIPESIAQCPTRLELLCVDDVVRVGIILVP